MKGEKTSVEETSSMAGGTQAHVRANPACITETVLLRSSVELHTVSEGVGDDDSLHQSVGVDGRGRWTEGDGGGRSERP